MEEGRVQMTTYTNMNIHICIYIYTHTHIYTTYTHTHTHTHLLLHIWVEEGGAHMTIYIYTYTCTYNIYTTHPLIDTHTYIYMPAAYLSERGRSANVDIHTFYDVHHLTL